MEAFRKIKVVYKSLPLLFALLAFIALHASGKGITLILTHEYSVKSVEPISINCIVPLEPGKLLIAGCVGKPPRAYAAVFDASTGSISPLAMPIGSNVLRSEITVCKVVGGKVYMFGYEDTIRNKTLYTIMTLWVWDGEVVSRFTLPALGVPLAVEEYGGITYILGFYGGVTTPVTLGILYAIEARLSDIPYMSKLNIHTRTLGHAGKLVFQHTYFTGALRLVTGSLAVVGYGRNVVAKLGNQSTLVPYALGFMALTDTLLQTNFEVKRLEIVPLASYREDDTLVLAGFRIDSKTLKFYPSLAVVREGGYVDTTVFKLENAKSASLFAVSCLKDICVAGGEVEINSQKDALIVLARLSDKGFVNGKTLKYGDKQGNETITAVTITRGGKVYAVVKKGLETRILQFVITEEQEEKQQAAPTQQNNTLLIVLGAVTAAAIASITIVYIKAKRHKG